MRKKSTALRPRPVYDFGYTHKENNYSGMYGNGQDYDKEIYTNKKKKKKFAVRSIQTTHHPKRKLGCITSQ